MSRRWWRRRAAKGRSETPVTSWSCWRRRETAGRASGTSSCTSGQSPGSTPSVWRTWPTLRSTSARKLHHNIDSVSSSSSSSSNVIGLIISASAGGASSTVMANSHRPTLHNSTVEVRTVNWLYITVKVNAYSSLQTYLTHVPYWSTQCYLPPVRGDIGTFQTLPHAAN